MGKYCIIGAGGSGVVTAKIFKQYGIPFDWFERETELGGLWNFSGGGGRVYQNTHMISSRRLSGFSDFPMPESYPIHPRHENVLDYVEAYADHFNLRSLVKFGTEVRKIWQSQGKWHVLLNEEEQEKTYDGVVIASGYHNIPNWPDYPGSFQGQIIHSRDYKHPKQLRGKRVLVVGAGNSGCDIAIDGAQHADKVFHSLRRGYHFLPKFLNGRPIDMMYRRVSKLPVPKIVKQLITRLVLKIAMGRPEQYGMPKPDHDFFHRKPIISSMYPYFLSQKLLNIRPDVCQFHGTEVEFVDGSRETVDLVIYATGYKPQFPYLDEEIQFHSSGPAKFFMYVFDSKWKGLFGIGLMRLDGGLFPIAELQAKLLARYIVALETGEKQAEKVRRLVAKLAQATSPFGIKHKSSNHPLGVDSFEYGKLLNRALAKTKRFTVMPKVRHEPDQPVVDEGQALAVAEVSEQIERPSGAQVNGFDSGNLHPHG